MAQSKTAHNYNSHNMEPAGESKAPDASPLTPPVMSPVTLSVDSDSGAGARETPADIKKITLKGRECAVEAVTVFTDRAEVTRSIPIDGNEAGQYEIVVTGLTELVVADSLRYARVFKLECWAILVAWRFWHAQRLVFPPHTDVSHVM